MALDSGERCSPVVSGRSRSLIGCCPPIAPLRGEDGIEEVRRRGVIFERVNVGPLGEPGVRVPKPALHNLVVAVASPDERSAGVSQVMEPKALAVAASTLGGGVSKADARLQGSVVCDQSAANKHNVAALRFRASGT